MRWFLEIKSSARSRFLNTGAWFGSNTAPTRNACGCPSDINEDGFVGFSDVLEVVASWGPCLGCAADVNNDGAVEVRRPPAGAGRLRGLFLNHLVKGGTPSDGPVGSVPCRNGCRKCRLRIGLARWMFFNTTGGNTSGRCRSSGGGPLGHDSLLVMPTGGERVCATSCLRWWPVVSTWWSHH